MDLISNYARREYASLIERNLGKRVRLVFTNDQYTELKSGDEGIVDHIDDTGTVFVKWDCGSSLGLNYEFGDRWVVVS